MESIAKLITTTTAKLQAMTVPEDVPKDRYNVEVLKQVGMPKRIRRTVLSGSMVRTASTDAVDRWLAGDGEYWALVLAAPVGVGKSTAAGHWLAQQLKDREPHRARTRRWLSASEFATLDQFVIEHRSLMTIPHLVLDDVGAEYSGKSEFVMSKMDTLFDARYREELPTMVTTNLNVEEFSERYSERVLDRLRQHGLWCEFDGHSMR